MPNIRKHWIVAGVVGIAMVVFPPVGTPITYGRLVDPTYALVGTAHGQVIDMTRLLIQIGLVALVAFGFECKRP